MIGFSEYRPGLLTEKDFFSLPRTLIAPIRRLTDVRLYAHHANSTHTRLHHVRARLRRRARRPPRDGGQAHLRQVRQVRLRPPVSRSFFSPGISALFPRFSGRKRVRTSPPDPAVLATRESHDAPPSATPRTWLCAHPFARASARKDPRATAPPPRVRVRHARTIRLFPGSPGRSREPPSANRRDARAARTCAKRFSSRANRIRIAPEPLPSPPSV